MRIAVFLDQSFPPDSRVENEAHSLVNDGHEVHMFSLNYRQLSPDYEVWKGIHVHRIKASKFIYKLSALAYTFPFFHNALRPAIRSFIEKVEPDALHVHDMVIAKAVMDENDKRFKLPLTLDLHENRPEILQFYPHLQRFLGKQLISIDKWRSEQNDLINRADKVILVTPEAVREAIVDSGTTEDKFLVVPNSIEKEIYDAYPVKLELIKEFEQSFNLVYVGDTGLRRGLDTVIQALPKLASQVDNIRLIIVGKSTQDDQLKSMAKEFGISERVQWAGWQDVSLFPTYIQAADICVSPLHRNKHHDTTLANKVFQYMASGKAQIVSDCPSQKHIIEAADCGLVHEAENPDSFCDCVLSYYNDEALRKRHESNAIEALDNKYQWSKVAQDLLKYYSDLETNLSSN